MTILAIIIIIIIIIIINSAQGRGWDHESECASKAGSS